MASTVAMYTALSGLNANARNLDVIGNNIANVNTNAYKTNRLQFASQLSRSFGLGAVAGENSGGSNPRQIGLGVVIAGTTRSFNPGSVSSTGNATDIAIAGDGFFIAQRGTERTFTRAGDFTKNTRNELVTTSGERILGYGVDSDFNIVRSDLVPITIPVGELRIAEPTTVAALTGNLNQTGTVAGAGSRYTAGALTDRTGPLGTDLLRTTSLLTDLDDPATAGSQALFQVDDVIRVAGVRQGALDQSRRLPDAELTITATTTVQDYLNFINRSLNIRTTTANTPNPDGQIPGAALDPATGVISVVGNTGSVNDLRFEATSFTALRAGVATSTNWFTTARAATATGESVRTQFDIFDSLGSRVPVELTFTLISKNLTGGSTWRYDIRSSADTTDPRIGTGTIRFDDIGRPVGDLTFPVTINRRASAARDPLTFAVELNQSVSAFNSAGNGTSAGPSELRVRGVDGTAVGTLSSFAVGANGIISGAFDNGETRVLGQLALAIFSNPQGLIDSGNNLFKVGANSGEPLIVNPGSFGSGTTSGGALELSNVDLSAEFINLILTSTGYSANSRVISSADQLLQQLLVIGR